jgi:hypothetical protein
MMVYSANLRKIILLALILVFGSLMVIRVVQRYHFGNEQFISLENEVDLAELAVQESDPMATAFSDADDSYDFANMLKLIDMAQYVKGTLRGNFGFATRRKKIEQQEARQLLQALTSERAALRAYIWDLKGHSRNSIPPRRYRSLMYYLEVLDGMVTEMRELLPQK